MIKPFISKEIEKGTEYYISNMDKRRTKYMNFILYTAILLIYPIVIINNLRVKDYGEFLIFIPMLVLFIYALFLNRTGKTQLGIIISSFTLIIIVCLVVATSNVQVGAPLVSLLIAIGSTIMVKKLFWKNMIAFLCLLTFIITTYYQLIYLPFDLIEYLIGVLILIFFYIGLSVYNKWQNKHENSLELKNKIIKEQSEQLLILEKEKHKQSLLLKQKDIEIVVANNDLQIKFKESLIDKLKDIEKGEEVHKTREIIFLLKQEIDSQKKINLMEQNISDISAQFYERLNQKHTNLSKIELELCSFIKLGLSTKEIAAIRNSNTNAVNVSKTRLRKKININKEENLKNYFTTL